MRPGRAPRRRHALGLLAAGAGAASLLGGAAVASADPLVVTATVFTGSAGLATDHTVALSTLEACPAYTGPGALTLYPGGSTDTLASGTTWTLAEILDCGLQIPLADVTDVAVLRPDGAPEPPLSPAALSDPTAYQDPAAPGALPVVSNDGGSALDIYARPWRGGSDDNAVDQVTDSGPVALDVYETAPPLVVHAHASVVRRGTRTERVALSATVADAAGAAVPSSALTWGWTLSTGASSARPTPTETVSRGTATVTVEVQDAATGTGGTASLTLTVDPRTGSGPAATHHGGGGTNPTRTVSGLGTTPPHHHQGSGTGTTSGSGTSTAPSSGTSTVTSSGSGSATPTGTGSATASTPTPAPARTTAATTPATAPPPVRPRRRRAAHSKPPATATHPRTPAGRRRTRTPRRRAAAGRLIRGRLIGDVTPRSAATSPLTAAAVPTAGAAVASPRATGRLTVPGAVLAGLAVAGLLGVGAARERRSVASSPGRLHR